MIAMGGAGHPAINDCRAGSEDQRPQERTTE